MRDWDWRDEAACFGQGDLFFPEEGEAGWLSASKQWKAKRVCQGCPVRMECLEWALAVPEEFGVWGGLDRKERARIRRQRRRAA